MTIELEDVIKLLLAILAGGLVGAEREFRDKAAGFRTLIFICVGAAMFTMFSLKLGGVEDPVRIAANIVTGVGFLGAGVLLREGGRIVGLTTASTIWLVAALGMGIGGGHYLISGTATAAILVVLWVFPSFERWIDNAREVRSYEVVCPIDPTVFEQLEVMFRESRLRIQSRKRVKSEHGMVCTWDAYGSPRNHERVVDKLFAHAEVQEFRY